ncbi:uncharacterized protein LOC126742816 [Anthonomus grandis grandis]|uniref:uncharacterized protein LOC126742816 n=1 Tax=Anthonomus grandis grandis TaxID=2921223 RepID=UPI002165C7D9|nr:uncharacterized protein LOC126742816 [Anthonomus grandis grandis]
MLQNTKFGWIVTGSFSMPSNKYPIKSKCNLIANESVQNQLRKFWEIEEVDNQKVWSLEENACEEHFINNLLVTKNGRIMVSLPLKESPKMLGDSRNIAMKRFLSLERRLISNEKLRELYTDFLTEYESLGHMTVIEDDDRDLSDSVEYYMPHHGVFKQSDLSTKLRVVFNASAPTSTGISLNDLQMTGPIIQRDLLSILLDFRMRSIVISSDIKMMYRQVLVSPEDRKLQRILWRTSPNETIKTYELNTVTYGTTAASFLAIRCLHQVADECENEHPIIANIIRNNMYVDDLLASVDSEEDAKYIVENISKILFKRGFELRKWKSNKKNVLLGNHSDSNVVEFSVNKEGESKTLGLLWGCDRDILTYKIRIIQNQNYDNYITKQTILSTIATIF